MDNFKDILVLLIMVAVTIVGSLAKSKKKVITPPAPTKADDEKSPWGDIFQHDNTEVFQEYEVFNEPKAVDNIAIVNNFNDRTLVATKASIDKRKNNAKVETTEFQDTEFIAEEFDLKRAVIYSEILKPKFED